MRSFLLFAFFLSFTIINAQEFNGYFNFIYNEDEGSITLSVPESRLGQEFLYVNSLSAGIGSNDIGLDRGQLGADRIVKFIRTGKKLLLVQPNQDYRAVSNNELERKAVAEAFAQSVIWGFEIKETVDGIFHIDMTKFLMRDAHGVSQRLKRTKQGSYKLDASRSAVWMERTKAFPENTEFDALLTFTGQADGRWIRSVAPSSDAISVRQHHSFIKLPDGNYKPRIFHPYSGFNQLSYFDYATPIESPITKRFIYRHRLEKKNPSATVSEAVEPIIYYIDPGCPDPIKSALMEGGAWWDQAFQAAGYAKGTFQVKELPAGADMLDVRYNVIQWVHRSTRGWSYGASISDPRTGEIMKGHVSLGSLRVRQDFLIAQGLLSPYGSSDNNNSKMKELALARLRQLSAHEIGHTIGLAHNFASSVNDRASVMDYPHPLVELAKNDMNFKNAYDTKIGEWDKRTITYGYQDFPNGIDENKELLSMISKTQKDGLHFISDRDSRPQGGLHPDGHLWDNGSDPVTEFNRLLKVRANAMAKMGEASITTGTPLSELEKLLVPIYLLHRYQLEAVSKLIGGMQYSYVVKGDDLDHKVAPVATNKQGAAVDALLNSIKPQHLKLPQALLEAIPPQAFGYARGRETFSGRTNLAFDAIAPAESYVHTVMTFLLNKDRLTRIHRHSSAHGSAIELDQMLNMIAESIFTMTGSSAYDHALNSMTQRIFFSHLLKLSNDPSVDPQVAADAMGSVAAINNMYLSGKNTNQAQYLLNQLHMAKANPADFKLPALKELPPGSPIGCGGDHFLD